MRCTSRKPRRMFFCMLLAGICALTGCGGLSYNMAYQVDSNVSSFNVVSRQDTGTAETFAANLCVVTTDIDSESVDMELAEAALLFSINDNQVLYAKNVHESLHPASLTKVMTALVALQNGSLDQVLTATSAVTITEAGAQLLGIKPGDTMTLDQALRIMLLYSANDVAMLVAEGVGGSVDNFLEMMNQEAKRLGATNTHFTNPHGLTAPDHYTTAYDMYLIFNEAIKYETFNEIIHMSNYQTTYYDQNGNAKEVDKNTTNQFLRGTKQAPANVTIIGGKTGSTSQAGNCLILLSRDVSGAPYISVVLKAGTSDDLYTAMTDLLEEINRGD